MIAFLPALEGRVAIPFALSSAILGAHVLPWWSAFLLAYFGSILPALPVIYLTRKIKNRFFTGFFQEKYSSKLQRLSSGSSELKKLALIASFVAIPLPMTGVWSGSVIAGLSALNIWKCLLAICLGSFVACGIILAVCILFAGSELAILGISLGLLVIFALFEIVSHLFRKNKSRI